ncbi:MAG: AzlD domain-containing protein [Gammaproteobacteria bacterium]
MDATIGIIFIMGLMAYGVRALPQILSVGRRFPEAWDRFLRYLSYALICSIIATTLFMAGHLFEAEAAPHRAVALLLTIFVAYRTKSPVTGMIVGTLLAWALSWMR